MGCGESKPAGGSSSAARNPYEAPAPKKPEDAQELVKNSAIDRDLDRARQQEELKVKLLLLGAGESGKSTIFKQMRILYGSPRTEDDLRMYGVYVRSNVVTAMRKLCGHLRGLDLVTQLSEEPVQEDSTTGMKPIEAFDLICAHLVDNTASPSDLDPPDPTGRDWVGQSPRAGLSPNNDAKLFLQLWKAIKVLWEVRMSRRCLRTRHGSKNST